LKKVFKDISKEERPLVFGCALGVTACIGVIWPVEMGP